MGRGAGYLWALPVTAIGLLVACLALRGGRFARVNGVLEATGGGVAWFLRHLPGRGRVLGMAMGHVIFALDEPTMHAVRDHERVHVRQFERWGILFFPAYGIAALAALARGRHPYFQNAFELAASRATSSESLPPPASRSRPLA